MLEAVENDNATGRATRPTAARMHVRNPRPQSRLEDGLPEVDGDRLAIGEDFDLGARVRQLILLGRQSVRILGASSRSGVRETHAWDAPVGVVVDAATNTHERDGESIPRSGTWLGDPFTIRGTRVMMPGLSGSTRNAG